MYCDQENICLLQGCFLITYFTFWTEILKILCRASIKGEQIPITSLQSKIGTMEIQTQMTLSLIQQSPEALYEDVGNLPVPVQNNPFEDGVIYALVLTFGKSLTVLSTFVMHIRETFDFRNFKVMGSSRKTFHEGS